MEEAGRLYYNGKFQESITLYRNLLATPSDETQSIQFNIAQCYTQVDSIETAMYYFHLATEKGKPEVKSQAWNNLGIMLAAQNNTKEALQSFYNALKNNPQNDNARFNYELLKRQMKPENKQENEEDEDNTPPDNSPPNNNEENDNPDGKSVEYWKQKFNYYRPDDTESGSIQRNYDSIPMDRAIELLEQMKNKEIEFIQQLRKSAAQENRKSGNKSEW